MLVENQDRFAEAYSSMSPRQITSNGERDGLDGDDIRALRRSYHAGKYQELSHGWNPLRRLIALGHLLRSDPIRSFSRPYTFHDGRLR